MNPKRQLAEGEMFGRNRLSAANVFGRFRSALSDRRDRPDRRNSPFSGGSSDARIRDRRQISSRSSCRNRLQRRNVFGLMPNDFHIHAYATSQSPFSAHAFGLTVAGQAERNRTPFVAPRRRLWQLRPAPDIAIAFQGRRSSDSIMNRFDGTTPKMSSQSPLSGAMV